MPDTKTAPAPEAEVEDTELAEIEQSVRSFDEAGLRRLYAERGFSDAEADVFIAPLRASNETNKRLLQRQQRSDLASYKSGLTTDFPLADPDMISGATKREMRASAERLQKFAERIAQAVGKTAGVRESVAERTDEQRERADAWGVPPVSATEVVRETPDRTWEALRSDAVHKPATQVEETKRGVIQNIKDNGPRQMRRASLGDIASRQSQRAAREAAAAKT